MTGPDPSKIYPNENFKQIVYVKNVITRPNIIVGDYTYSPVMMTSTVRKSLKNTLHTIMNF